MFNLYDKDDLEQELIELHREVDELNALSNDAYYEQNGVNKQRELQKRFMTIQQKKRPFLIKTVTWNMDVREDYDMEELHDSAYNIVINPFENIDEAIDLMFKSFEEGIVNYDDRGSGHLSKEYSELLFQVVTVDGLITIMTIRTTVNGSKRPKVYVDCLIDLANENEDIFILERDVITNKKYEVVIDMEISYELDIINKLGAY